MYLITKDRNANTHIGEKYSALLYGLIHSRFILTAVGLEAMVDIYIIYSIIFLT